MRERIGSANAAVLPVPVDAWPSRSAPSSNSGMVLRLDRRRGFVADVHQGGDDGRTQTELGEARRGSLFSHGRGSGSGARSVRAMRPRARDLCVFRLKSAYSERASSVAGDRCPAFPTSSQSPIPGFDLVAAGHGEVRRAQVFEAFVVIHLGRVTRLGLAERARGQAAEDVRACPAWPGAR